MTGKMHWKGWLAGALAWIGLGGASWCLGAAPFTMSGTGANMVLRETQVQWFLNLPPGQTPPPDLQVLLGDPPVSLTIKNCDPVGPCVLFTVPKDTFEGIVPIKATGTGVNQRAELVVLGHDAQVPVVQENTTNNPNASVADDLTLLTDVCPGTRPIKDSEAKKIAEAAGQSLSSSGLNFMVKSAQVHALSNYPNAGLCNCQLLEITLTLKGKVGEISTLSSNLLQGYRNMLGRQLKERNYGTSITQPSIKLSAATHGDYHAGPDHIPLYPLNKTLIMPIKLPGIQGQKPSVPALVAVLDTGLTKSNTLAAQPGFKALPAVNFSNESNGLDTFNVNAGFAAGVRNAAGSVITGWGKGLGQGRGHGTPIASLASAYAGGAATILPIKVCDKNGLCPDWQIIQGICYALKTYSESDSKQYSGLVINLSLGSFTPSLLMGRVLDDARSLSSSLGSRFHRDLNIYVVAAAGNAFPTQNSREMMARKLPSVPHYLPATAAQWDAFLGQHRYAMVFPAGFEVPSTDPTLYAGQSLAALSFQPRFDGNNLILSVASLEQLKNGKWQLADTSVRGRHNRLCAPGRYVQAISSNGKNNVYYTGTSFATPAVAGAMANLLATGSNALLSSYPFTEYNVGCGDHLP